MVVKSEMQIEFEKQLTHIIEITLTCVRLVNLVDEYQRLLQAKDPITTKYDQYFSCIYNTLSNYTLIEIFKLFDDSGSDCINLDKIKSFAYKNFDSIFPMGHDYSIYAKREFSEIDKDELFQAIKTLTKRFEATLDIIKRIRNKKGLAHGMYSDYSDNVDFHDVKLLIVYVARIIDMLTERYSNTRVDFYGDTKRWATLKDLSNDYSVIVKSNFKK